MPNSAETLETTEQSSPSSDEPQAGNNPEPETPAASVAAPAASSDPQAAPASAPEEVPAQQASETQGTEPAEAVTEDVVSDEAVEAESAPTDAPEDSTAAQLAASQPPEPAEGTAQAAVESAAEATDEAAPIAAETPTATDSASSAAAKASAPPSAAGETEETAAETAEPAELKPELVPLIEAMNNGETVNGTVIGWNKGGFHVSLEGVPAFCPKSQIELGNPRRANAYVDRGYDFKITEIRDGGKRVVVSRKSILKEQRTEALERLRQAKSSSETLRGRISSITEFGAFVDVGGVEGLVHLSQLSRKRVERVQDVAQLGQEVDVKVLKIEKGGERISLSMRATEPDPWDSLAERWKNGDTFHGTVVRRADFGLFVEIEEGVEGLVHESALPHGTSLGDDAFSEQKQIAGWIKDVDPRRKRLSLSMREVAQTNPWHNVLERYPEGSMVKATVEQVAKFGVFAELEPGLTGLLPISSLHLPTGVRAERQFRPGQEMQVVIDSVDTKRKRISLAPVGSQLEGTRADLKAFQRQQQETSTGLNAMRAAFEKLGLDADA